MQISNNHLSLTVAHRGAEPVSLLFDGRECLWQGNPSFWKRHAPILFPIVGKVFDNTYRVGTQEFHLPQHGFARDSDFDLIQQTADTLAFRFESNADTRQCYPYPFTLTARYQLTDNQLCCQWRVENPASQEMFFMIGAHPAFNYLLFNPDDPVHGYLQFFLNDMPVNQLAVTQLSQQGYALPDTCKTTLNDGLLPLTRDTFRHDALVLENHQADRVVMLDKRQQPILQVAFDAPLFGLWSPVGAPFCCIEPWYGRTDREGFVGPIHQRQHIQHLAPHSNFVFTHTVTLFQ